MSDTAVGLPLDEAERDALIAILGRCFQAPEEALRLNLSRVGEEDVLLVRQGGRVVGGALRIPMAQWFGGSPVPMAGVALVGIDPVARGKGAGRALMEGLVRQLAAEGVALSTLYPATVALYRHVGYELAGSRHAITLPLAGLAARERALPLREGGPADFPAMEAARRLYASLHPGMVERGAYLWPRARAPRGETARHYLVEDEGRLTGYISFVQVTAPNFSYDMELTDLVVLTPGAGRRLLAFLASHRSLARQVRWHGGDRDPLLALMDEPAAEARLLIHWMCRICHLPAALEARGYPAGLEAALPLQVEDALVPANDGRWVLEVAGGRGRLRPGGEGRLRLSIRGLAALYTGFRSPAELVSLGLAQGPADDLERAQAVFAGPSPWMADMF